MAVVTALLAIVVDADTAAEPLKLPVVPVTSPVNEMVRPVVKVAALPVVFWFSVGKVQFVNVPEAGVPKAGVTSVGLLANTKAPEPVSSETADAKLAEEGVAKNVATPEPRPDTPVAIGRPVAFVNVPDAGVPKAGVTIVGEMRWSVCWATFVPSDHTDMVLPAGMAMVVPPLNVMPFLVVELEMVAT